jgi:FtsZ-interacting cell division protein ZipA
MPELRWTLLIIGVLFVLILAWWERRRPHQASRQAPHIGGEPRPVVGDDASWGPDAGSGNSRVVREPALTLPEIRTEVRMPVRDREPTSPRELPIVEIPDDSLIGMRVEGEHDDEEVVADEIAAVAEEVAADEAIDEELIEDELEDEELEEREPIVPVAASVPVVEEKKAPELPPPPPGGVKPIVDWPPEDQRTLVSLRLVARPPERFRGNLLRQALAAEGFVLGDLDIFHKPDANNRAVLSAASLTKPGTFDLETMDIQRFTGLNLFAVLPGPKTPQKAFEDLLLTARMLNERLEGALQDERGGPLTPMRIQALRNALGAEAKS